MNPADNTGESRKVCLPGRDRLDKELCGALHLSRETAKQMIRAGRVRIGEVTRHHPARRLGKPTEIEILNAVQSPAANRIPVERFDVEIIYEDDALLALNKPAGMTVHPGAGHEQNTLVDWLRAKGVPLAHSSDADRAGLVHRLDKDTSGLILVAKLTRVAEKLMVLFAERQIEKEYRAVVQGRVPRRMLKIVGAIGRNPNDRKKFGIQTGGREAITWIESLGESGNISFIRVIPKTGRTHQIRVHLKHAGFPILGDPVYGIRNIFGLHRMLLHAFKLGLIHPDTGKKLELTAPLPKEFVDALACLGLPFPFPG